jgi:hypothetical protein
LRTARGFLPASSRINPFHVSAWKSSACRAEYSPFSKFPRAQRPRWLPALAPSWESCDSLALSFLRLEASGERKAWLERQYSFLTCPERQSKRAKLRRFASASRTRGAGPTKLTLRLRRLPSSVGKAGRSLAGGASRRLLPSERPILRSRGFQASRTGRSAAGKEGQMPTWLWIVLIVLLVLVLFGGFGYGRRA